MSKLFKKTLIMFIVMFGATATIISGYAGWILYNRIIEEYKSKAIAIANNMATSSLEIILNRDASTIQSIVDQYSEIQGLAYVMVVQKDGEILCHTFAPNVPYELTREIERPREKRDQVIAATVRLQGLGVFLDISAPILSGLAGYVHIGMDLDGVRKYIWMTIVKLHLVTFVIFLVAVSSAFILTNRISRPLIQLAHYAARVAGRDFSAPLDIQSKDEVGVLAVTMANMAAEIETKMGTLEQTVQVATQELQDTLGFVSAIMESLADGLLVMDPDGRISRSNAALLHILELDHSPQGESVRGLMGGAAADFLYRKGEELRSSLALCTPCDALPNASLPDAVEGTRSANTAEITATKADGTPFPVELSASVVNMKGVWYTIGMVRDITTRKRAEDALRLSEEKYRGIFEHAVDGIFQTDARGRLVNANPASASILGYDSPAELLHASKKQGDNIYVDPRRQEEFISVMQGGKVVHGFEVQLRRKDGTAVWASLHARPMRNEIGDLLSTEGIVQDVTERKMAEEALLESERRYRHLFDITPDPMIVHREGRILFGNQAAADFLRVTDPETLIGLAVLDSVHPDFRDKVGRRISDAQRGGISPDFAEVQFLRADGSVGYMESIAVPTSYKGQRAVLSLGRDITQRKEAQEALRASEERFRTIFEIAPDCIFLKDQDLVYTHVNPATEALFGCAATEIIGKRAEDFFGAEAASHIREGDLRVLAGETIEDEHTRTVRGMSLTFHDIRTPLRNSAGAVVGVCKFSRNITERKGVRQPGHFTETVYKSKAMRATLHQAMHAAQGEAIVLLLGESGSGKDYVARWIHSKSKRADAPFFSLNCAAISRELAESELFGHERGAFTGAVTKKRGLLELAEGGTLLLNEIGELPLPLQSKLLTFLDTRSFTRVGGEKHIRVNARLIAATHRDLESEVAENRFLEPLYYRLNVYTVHVPALRDRLEDIPMLVEEILLSLAHEMQLTQVPTLQPEDLDKLLSYPWKGNVRELRNVLESAVMLASGPKVALALPRLSPRSGEWSYEVRLRDSLNLAATVDDLTQRLCKEALRRTGGNRKEAAAVLGVSRQSLYRYMKGHDAHQNSDTTA
ncbi:MAG: PAS domain S-box protein [Thermodesulfobacteriota bacterium]